MDELKRLARERDRKHLAYLFALPYHNTAKSITWWTAGRDCTLGTHEHTVLYPQLPKYHLEDRGN